MFFCFAISNKNTAHCPLHLQLSLMTVTFFQTVHRELFLDIVGLQSSPTNLSILRWAKYMNSLPILWNCTPKCLGKLLMHLFSIDSLSCLPDKVFQGSLIPATFRITSRFSDVIYANPSFHFLPPLFSPSQILPQYFLPKMAGSYIQVSDWIKIYYGSCNKANCFPLTTSKHRFFRVPSDGRVPPVNIFLPGSQSGLHQYCLNAHGKPI